MSSDPLLTGLKVLELGGLAPGPFCGMLLSTYGADVLRVDRPGKNPPPDPLTSYKSSIALDLKSPASIAVLKSLLPTTDVLIDPFRPGVLEKLGLDPENVMRKINPRLIVVRLTGFRRDGKYKDMAGHDINYLAVSGILSMLGERGKPPLPPGNVLADFAGGGAAAFMGVLLALIHRSVGGNGQIVEANMVDGVGYLGTFLRVLKKSEMWQGERGTNTLDGGAPYYGCYECEDQDRYMSVGALEPQFYAALLNGLDLKPEDVVPGGLPREDKRSWPYMREVLTKRFKQKTRTEWEAIFDGTDACCAPVLEYAEMEEAGYEQRPIVTLRTTRARPVDMQWHGRPLKPGQDGDNVLKRWKGWTRGRDYDEQNGALIIREKAKL